MTDIPEIKVTYSHKLKMKDRPKITSSYEAYVACRKLFDPSTIELREEMHVLVLNNGLQILGSFRLSQGGFDTTTVCLRLLFATALKCNASAIIVSHNHPTGQLKPSKTDIRMTKRIVEAAKILGIDVQDHIIMTADAYTSMKSEGFM